MSYQPSYEKNNDPERVRFQTDVGKESMTKQSHKAECDINNIMKRYQKTGVLSHVNEVQPVYGDVPAIEYREALEAVMKAEEMFNSMPGSLRREFDNDPAQFLDFVQNEKNLDRMYELGLAVKPTEELPVRVQVINPPDPTTT